MAYRTPAAASPADCLFLQMIWWRVVAWPAFEVKMSARSKTLSSWSMMTRDIAEPSSAAAAVRLQKPAVLVSGGLRRHRDFKSVLGVILDIDLGDGPGIEQRQCLWDENVEVPGIHVTGNDNRSVREAPRRSGCRTYLTKPFSAELLRDLLEKHRHFPVKKQIRREEYAPLLRTRETPLRACGRQRVEDARKRRFGVLRRGLGIQAYASAGLHRQDSRFSLPPPPWKALVLRPVLLARSVVHSSRGPWSPKPSNESGRISCG